MVSGSLEQKSSLPPAKRSLGQGNVFTRMSHSAEGGLPPGGSASGEGGFCLQGVGQTPPTRIRKAVVVRILLEYFLVQNNLSLFDHTDTGILTIQNLWCNSM